MTIQEIRARAHAQKPASFFETETAFRLAADFILADVLDCDTTAFLQAPEREVSLPSEDQFEQKFQAYLAGTPVAYIVGWQEFYGRPFAVSPETLIPRPETEQIIDGVKEKIGTRPLRVWDVGTGTGAIAITLSKECPQLAVCAVDQSEGALQIARQNNRALGAQVDIQRSDLLSVFSADGRKADIIIANLPYVSLAEYDELHASVRDHEPKIALVGGEEGTEIIFQFLDESCRCLEDQGWVFVEIGCRQGESVSDRMKALGFQKVTVQKDYAGLDRVVMGQWKG